MGLGDLGPVLTSDGGVMLLANAERRLGLAARLGRLIPDRRDPTRVTHTLADMMRARVFAICCGYEDGTVTGTESERHRAYSAPKLTRPWPPPT